MRSLVAAFAIFLTFAPTTSYSTRSGPTVIAAVSHDNSDLFQTLIIMHALVDLGYQVQAPTHTLPSSLHRSVSAGDVSFMTSHRLSLDNAQFSAAGGYKALVAGSALIGNVTRGFQIDAATSLRRSVTNIEQLRDPSIAKLFDHNGNGKADLIGCNSDQACASQIDEKIQAYGLFATVEQVQGENDLLLTAAASRARLLRPILYYAKSTDWINGERPIGEKAVWLNAPSEHAKDGPTGFVSYSVQIVANKTFAAQNPPAAQLFGIVNIPIQDITRQNLKMHLGEDSTPDIERHAKQWIRSNRALYDGWITKIKGKSAK